MAQICCRELFGPDFSASENSNTTSVTAGTALVEILADFATRPFAEEIELSTSSELAAPGVLTLLVR